MQSVVEECNRYPDEEFDTVVRDLNIATSETKTKLSIDSVVGRIGEYKGVEFIPDMDEVDFDNFSASFKVVPAILYDGDSAPQQPRYVDLSMGSFESEIDGEYTFIYEEFMIKCSVVVPTFSSFIERGKHHRFSEQLESRTRKAKSLTTSGECAVEEPIDNTIYIPF